MRLLERVKVENLIQMEAARDDMFRDKVQDKLEENGAIGGFGFISELRKMLGLSKVKASVQVIKDMLEDTDKLVVFTWHKDVATELCQALQDYGPQKIVGDTPNQRRHEIVNMFQTDKTTRVLVANIQAAGVGLTLTKASKVVFVEPSWVPSDNDQAISRVHRIGQERPVQAFFLVVKDSLDHLILNAHQNKSVVINSAIKPKE
jgi:SWI/SNF-related matrix-associated actin-dependent regulator 1 of chromatin subfamily A